jgi:Zn finger protein HypA/HybF involved in hydrogenase expression
MIKESPKIACECCKKIVERKVSNQKWCAACNAIMARKNAREKYEKKKQSSSTRL